MDGVKLVDMMKKEHGLTVVVPEQTWNHRNIRRNIGIAWLLTVLSLFGYLAVSGWVGHVQEVAHHVGHAAIVAWLNAFEIAATVAFGMGIFAIEYRWLVRPWRWAAQHDALTGLLNQGAFWQTAERLWSQHGHKSSLTMMIADVDHFKTINDHAGHLRGDQVLAHIGYTLRQSHASVVVGRIGGEEFAALWVEMALPDVLRILEKWRTMVQDIDCPEGMSHVTISMGLATCSPNSGQSLSGLARLADEALYQAKSNGRDRIELAQCSE